MPQPCPYKNYGVLFADDEELVLSLLTRHVFSNCHRITANFARVQIVAPSGPAALPLPK
jgi:hypothetical protein